MMNVDDVYYNASNYEAYSAAGVPFYSTQSWGTHAENQGGQFGFWDYARNGQPLDTPAAVEANRFPQFVPSGVGVAQGITPAALFTRDVLPVEPITSAYNGLPAAFYATDPASLFTFDAFAQAEPSARLQLVRTRAQAQAPEQTDEGQVSPDLIDVINPAVGLIRHLPDTAKDAAAWGVDLSGIERVGREWLKQVAYFVLAIFLLYVGFKVLTN